MKEVKFKFEDGHEEIINIESGSLNTELRMSGVAAHQNGISDPEEWMDDYNDWSEDEGRPEGGDCVGFKIV